VLIVQSRKRFPQAPPYSGLAHEPLLFHPGLLKEAALTNLLTFLRTKGYSPGCIVLSDK
jgi:hypothetical protein